jgi:outer membrane protein TolC
MLSLGAGDRSMSKGYPNGRRVSTGRRRAALLMTAAFGAAFPAPRPAAALGLAEAVSLALEHNLGLRGSGIEIAIAEQGVLVLQARYATQLTASAMFELTQLASPLDPDVVTVLHPRLLVAAERPLVGGTKLTLRAASSYEHHVRPASSPWGVDDSGRLLVGISVTQALLSGFGTHVGLAGVRAAAEAVEQKRLERLRAASEVAMTVEQAYWEAFHAIRLGEIRRAAVALADEDLVIAQARVAAGEEPEVSLLQLEAARARSQEAVILADQARDEVIERLRQLLGRAGDEDAVDLWPSDVPAVRPAPPGIAGAAEAEARVVRNNLELAVLARSIKKVREELVGVEDAARPWLDISASLDYMPQVSRGDVFDPTEDDLARDDVTRRNFKAFDARVGLNFSYPLGNEGPEARLTTKRLELAGLDLKAEELRRELRTRVRAQIGRVGAARERIAVNEVGARLAARTADGQRAQYRVGLVILNDVLDAERHAEEARVAELSARVEYLNALATLEHLTGALVERWGMRVD